MLFFHSCISDVLSQTLKSVQTPYVVKNMVSLGVYLGTLRKQWVIQYLFTLTGNSRNDILALNSFLRNIKCSIDSRSDPRQTLLKIEVSESPILNFLSNIYTRFMAYELPMTFELVVFHRIRIGGRDQTHYLYLVANDVIFDRSRVPLRLSIRRILSDYNSGKVKSMSDNQCLTYS